MTFQKGDVPWNKGLTKETDDRVRKRDVAWNKGLTKETDERIRKGQVPWIKGLTKETDERVMKMSEDKKGKKIGPFSKEFCQNVSERMKKNWTNPEYRNKKIVYGKNNSAWRGGNYDYYHNQAWINFGKLYCKQCGKSNEEHINQTGNRLHMHCVDENWKNLSGNNWICLCVSCHQKLENQLRKVNEHQINLPEETK